MADHSGMKLGKREARIDSRTLRLSKYLTPAIPSPPDELDYTKGILDFGVMLNDNIGDCTCAAAGHAIQIATANSGEEITPSDAEILAAYEAVGGYQPGNESTDNGADELDVLNYWRTTGIAGKKIIGYADPAVDNITHIKQAIMLFGGLYIGIGLPLSAQFQEVWDISHNSLALKLKLRLVAPVDPTAPWSWGGHAVYVPAYNLIGPVCITWGKLKQMTWAFWNKYVDEAHAVLLPDWIGADDLSASGFNLATLQEDLQGIAA